MPFPRPRTTLICALFAALFLPASARPQDVTPDPAAERWRGALAFRGDRWPVQIWIERTDDGCRALLDLPALVYAREPVETSCSDQGFRIAMPFGLGTFELRSSGLDAIRASRVLAGDTALLELAVNRTPPPRFEELFLERKGVCLPGVLAIPPGEGPHPAVVLVHGSQPMGRDDWEYRSWADLFARRGVAALYYDKRSLARDGANRPSPSFEELALDALAAVDSLRARADVDARRIGLAGGSQAGWLALLATSLSDDEISFLVLRSAPGVTPAEQEEQSVVHRLRAAGSEAGVVQDALAHSRLFFYVVQTGEGWRELEASLARGREAGWADVVQQPRGPEDLSWWRAHHDFDPLPLARSLRTPTLLMYGGDDPIVPPVLNGPVLREALPDSTPVQMEIFPDADHGLEIGAGRAEDGRWRFPHRPDRMFYVLDAWLSEQVAR